jgi:predicted dehydrogenase
MDGFGAAREVAEASELVADPEIDSVSVCLPNHLHLPIALAALKAKKHVVCETPPVLNAGEAKKLASAAAKAGKVLLYAFQRRFGGSEQAAKLAIDKGYAGELYHARASWMRTRGVPVGTGWYTDKSRSGGGVVLDLGVQMLDLGYDLLGRPKPASVFATTGEWMKSQAPPAPGHAGSKFDVEDTFSALIRFEGGKSLELAATWAMNQPPQHNGTVCRLHGDKGAIDVYTRQGPVLYRNFAHNGHAKETLMKMPKVVNYHAMMRHFREAIAGKAKPLVGPAEGASLMAMIDAIYRSAATGRSVDVK